MVAPRVVAGGGLSVTRPLRRIRSSLRNSFDCVALFSFPLRKNAWRQNSAGLNAGIAHSGQETGLRISYHQPAEFDASAPSRWRSRACLALSRRRRTVIRTGRPCPPQGRPGFVFTARTVTPRGPRHEGQPLRGEFFALSSCFRSSQAKAGMKGHSACVLRV
jgi:hypothetical protein